MSINILTDFMIDSTSQVIKVKKIYYVYFRLAKSIFLSYTNVLLNQYQVTNEQYIFIVFNFLFL